MAARFPGMSGPLSDDNEARRHHRAIGRQSIRGLYGREAGDMVYQALTDLLERARFQSWILDLDDVSRITTLGGRTILRAVKEGEFPPPVELLGRRIGWPNWVIDQWIRERPPAGS